MSRIDPNFALLGWQDDQTEGAGSMQVLRSVEFTASVPASQTLRALVLTAEDSDTIVQRIAGQGCKVEHVSELFAALDRLLSDPTGYGLFVMDTDAFGGLSAGKRAFRLLGTLVSRISVILISSDCAEQEFAEDRLAPTVLRAPASVLALRVGLENILQQRKALYA